MCKENLSRRLYIRVHEVRGYSHRALRPSNLARSTFVPVENPVRNANVRDHHSKTDETY